MLALFCLRLAWGLIASLLLLSPSQVHPRFFRVQYLIALGLLAVAGFFLSESMHPLFGVALAGSFFCCIAGSIVWHLHEVPLAGMVGIMAVVSLTLAVYLGSQLGDADLPSYLRTLNEFSAAALLGGTMSAMLMGHSYLIAPAMSLTPLMRLLAAMGLSLVLRVILGTVGLFELTGQGTLEFENLLWLSLRWLVGFAGVLILGWMAWETARIRSTQSATGILYVVVIFCFFGEAISQFLTAKTGCVL